MRYFFDLEFIERPSTIIVISIGIVAESGKELYMQSSEVDWSMADEWILVNVKPHLTGVFHTREDIKDELLQFFYDDPEPEFWAYNGAFDWVGFVWFFGRLLDIPSHWPKRHREIKDLKEQAGNPPLPVQQGVAHLAIDDAKWNMQVYNYLTSILERPTDYSS